MNTFSLPKNQTLFKASTIFVLSALVCLLSIQFARADGAPPPDPTVGGVGPYQPQKTNVQMMSETVLIEVPPSPTNLETPKQIKVNASFTMQNQGQTEEQMQVIFPLTRLGYGGSMEQALYKVDTSSFIARVDGKTVPIGQITTPPEIISTDMEHGFPEEVQWASFPATFPVKQNVILQVEYEMLNEYGEDGVGFTGIAYILETGAGWYGNILSADIALRLPYPVSDEAITFANPGYIISGNEMQWKLRDFEPARQDNLEVRVIQADLWKSILDLRSKAKQAPNDVDTWTTLGDKYTNLGISTREGYILYVEPHFTQLAIEARQEAVKLNPKSGDNHYKLAEILWLSNPGIVNKFRMGGESTAPEPALDDPAMQQILHEMQLAWSLGTTNSLPYFEEVFPQLAFSQNGIVTVTLAPRTQTFAPFTTSTVPSTVMPTVPPAATPTLAIKPVQVPLSSNSHQIIIFVAFSLIIIGGVIVFRQKVKR